MKKFYPIIRRKFHWELLLITLFIFAYPSICEAANYGTNLITDGNAAKGNGNTTGGITPTDWNTTSGTSFFEGEFGFTSPDRGGVFDFYTGSTSPEWISQEIDISSLSADISAGTVKMTLSAYMLKGHLASTICRMILEQVNGSNTVIATSQVDNDVLSTVGAGDPSGGTWAQKTITINGLNTSTRKLRIKLYGELVGTDGQSFVEFDGISLVLTRWPAVTNTAASSITASSAVLGGNVTTDGSPANTERGIVYSTTNTNPAIGGANVTQVPLSGGSGIFTTTLSGLSGAQKYYYNAYATNTLGTVYGTVNNFTTVTPTYLTATTNDATNVTINSVTLNGSVNANGRTTDVYFQYGTTTSYGTQVAASPSTATGTSATTETVSVTGLLSSTQYHVRMAAYNATEGWKYGEDKIFTTLTPVPEIELKQSSTAIADGGSYDYGYHQPSSTTDIIFTIENTGTKALTITTPIAVGGSNSDQFSIQSQPASSVAVSGSTTFTVRFSPTSIGNKTATISIINDDSNENPYDLTITGQGYLAPTVTTSTASNVLATTATLNGSVNANNNSTTVTFQYGLTTGYGSSATASQSPVTGTSGTAVSSATSGLTPNALYHYRAVGTNLGGTINGTDQTFTTPVIEDFTDETTEYGRTFTEGGTTFTMTGYLYTKYEGLGGFNGTLGDNNSISNLYNIAPSAGIFGSILNSTNNFYVNNFWIAPGNAAYTFGQYGNVIIRGKRSGTTLFTYTLTSANTNGNYAVNNNYTYIDLSSYNSILIDELEFEVTDNIRYLKIDAFNFNYPSAFASNVTTQAVNSIGATTATGNGNITNLGNPNPTAYGVCWSTTSGAETATGSYASNGSASATGAFTTSMTGLTANTTYYVKAYATNIAGTVYGSEVSFTTLTNGTFTAATNNDWATASNWASNSIPTSATDVTIPSGKNPIISATTQASCNNLTVTGTLTIQSSASGTGSLIISGTSAGTVNCERYMTGSAWHIVSPIAAFGSISTFIQTPGNAIPSKDVTGTNRYGMMDYNEATNTWNTYYAATTSDILPAGKGYSMRRASDGIVTFTGDLTSGTKLVWLGKGGTGWNCIGNPYTSAINMNNAANASYNFLKTNAIDNTSTLDPSYACMYLWDDATLSYKILGNVSFGTRNLAQNVLQAGQGFFVKAASDGVIVQFTNNMQAHQTATPFRAPAVTTSWPGITLTATSAATSSAAIITFNRNMTKGLDPTYDAGLLRGTNGLSLYTRLVEDNGVDFAIQCLPENYDNLVIPVGVDCKDGGEITFSAEPVELPKNCKVMIEDKTTNTFTSLAEGATYKTTVLAGTSAVGRFYIHTGLNTTTGTSGLTPETSSLKAYIANDAIIIEGEVSDQAIATLYNLQGLKLHVNALQKGSLNTLPCSYLTKGIYLLTIQQNGKTETKKLIKE
jgi:hypothetical protein